jgi:hypothetical protein
MSSPEVYTQEIEICGDSTADLGYIKQALSRSQDFEVGFLGEGLYVRTHGIELELYEDGFEATIAPYHRKDDGTPEELADMLSSEYSTDTRAILGTGFSGGGD